MFTRTHTINGIAYTEALRSYRDPVTGKPKHHCAVRWPANMPLAAAINEASTKCFELSRKLHEWEDWKAMDDVGVEGLPWSRRTIDSNIAALRRRIDKAESRVRDLEYVEQALRKASPSVVSLAERAAEAHRPPQVADGGGDWSA